MKMILAALALIIPLAVLYPGEVIDAVREGDSNALLSLLKKGKNPNETDGYTTPLMTAVDRQDLEMARLLIRYKANVNFKLPESGTTALMHAASLGDYDDIYIRLAALFLSNGAKLDDTDSSKRTALMIAVESSPGTNMVNYLLSCKPQLDLVNSWGNTALYTAVFYENATLAAMLMKAGANSSILKREDKFLTAPIHYAVERGYYEVVKAMLENGADVNIRTRGGFGGQTPLHRAVDNRNPDMVRLLLKYKPDVNARDDAGGTPLYYALHGSGADLEEIVELLTKAGAKR